MSLGKLWVMVAMAIPLLVMSCGGGDDPTATPRPPATTVPATAAPGSTTIPEPTAIIVKARVPQGTLNVGVPSMGSEQWRLRTTTGEHPILHMGDPLVWWDFENDAPIPEAILESWDSTRNADGSVDWVLKIRKGIQFHKGQGEVTAEDVKFTFLSMQLEGTVNSYAIYFRDFFGDDEMNMVVEDDYTLKVRMPEQKSALYRLFYVFGPYEARHLRPFPKAYHESVGEDGFAQEPVFAGPFAFENHERGFRLTLSAVADHYRNIPGFAELNYFKVVEPATRIAQVRAGQVDIAVIEPKFADELKAAGVTIEVAPATRGSGFPFGGLFPGRDTCDATVPWVGGCTSAEMLTGNPLKIRQALAYAIDRDLMIEKILLGFGQKSILNFAGIDTNASWWDSSWKPYEYNLPLAKQLLTEAGYPNCFEFNIYLNTGYATGVDLGEAVASTWEQELGCTVNRTVGEYLPFRTKLLNRDTDDIVFGVSAGGSAWKFPYMYGCLHGGPAYQVIVWTELEFWNELCPQMESTLDAAEFDRLNNLMGQADIDSLTSAGSILSDTLFAIGPKVEPGSWQRIPGRNTLALLDTALPAK